MRWDLKILDAIESMECREVGAPVTALVTAAAIGVAQYILTDGKSGWLSLYSACIGVGFVFVFKISRLSSLGKVVFPLRMVESRT